MNHQKLRGRIVEKYGSQRHFCEEFGLCSVTLNYKLTGKRDFSVKEITKLCELLEISKVDIPVYFFANIVD